MVDKRKTLDMAKLLALLFISCRSRGGFILFLIVVDRASVDVMV